MKQHDLKVAFYLNKNETKADGKCPVIGKITVGHTTSKFRLKLAVPVNLWSGGRAKGNTQAAIEINSHLDDLRASALYHHRELSAVKEGVTAEEVKFLILGMASGQQSLIPYFRAFNENFIKRIGVNRKKGSESGYIQALDHLTRFLKEKYNVSDIPFAALDRSFIDKFDLYLKVDRGLSPGTIVFITTRLNIIIGNAIVEGIITKNPFAGYVPPRPVRQQKYLTSKELELLMTTPLDCPKHYLVRDLFLFSCYTGIPYVDMKKLTEEELYIAPDNVTWIKTNREKTGMDYQIPLLELPLHIIQQYKGAGTNGRLLPMYSNSELNRELKNIARTCGIDRRLTFHMGRHTYATEVTLSNGVPMESVSRMLGHRAITTTQIYAKVTDDKIDNEITALESRIAAQFAFAI